MFSRQRRSFDKENWLGLELVFIYETDEIIDLLELWRSVCFPFILFLKLLVECPFLLLGQKLVKLDIFFIIRYMKMINAYFKLTCNRNGYT